MYLDKLITLNWGQLEHRELKLGQVTLLAGGTGSGKSTTADAIQTLMTAAKDGIFLYNPGQDEASQRSRIKEPRTIASYALGADMNEYARPNGAHSYIAGVFVPSPGETAQPFTALIGVVAHLETQRLADSVKRTAILDDLQLFTLEGVRLDLDHLVRSHTETSLEVIPVGDIYGELKKRFGQVVRSHSANKKLYLESLYGLLKGGRASSVEAEQAAKTFARFMAYKPLESINEFVRNQVLEPHDLRQEVENISRLIREVTDLRVQAERYQRNLEFLGKAKHSGAVLIQAWEDRLKNELCQALKQRHLTHIDISNLGDSIAREEKNGQRVEAAIQRLDKQMAGLDGQERLLDSQRQQHAVAGQKDRLDLELNNARNGARADAATLAGQATQLGKNKSLVRQLSAISEDELTLLGLAGSGELLARATELDALSNERALGEIINDLIRQEEPTVILTGKLIELVAGTDQRSRTLRGLLVDDEGSIYGRVTASQHEKSQALNKLKDDIRESEATLARLARGEADYPGYVRTALVLLNEELPKAKPRVLCDLVEPRSEEWQPLIEAYMAEARFRIIVELDFEAPARRLLTTRFGRDSATIVQGALAQRDAARIEIPRESVVHELSIADPVAKAYVEAQFGNVVKVKDVEALRHVRRGISPDGNGAGSYGLFALRSPGALTFGRKAREEHCKRLASGLKEMQENKARLEGQVGRLRQLGQLSLECREISVEPVTVALDGAARRIAEVRHSLSLLDLTSLEELDQGLKAVREQKVKTKEERDEQLTESGSIKTRLDNFRRSLKTKQDDELPRHEDAVTDRRIALTPLVLASESFDPERTFALMLAEAEDDAVMPDQITERINSARRRIGMHRTALKNDIAAYNQGGARASEQVELDIVKLEETEEESVSIDAVANVLRDVHRQYSQQKDFGLADKHGQLKQAEGSFNTAFTSNFCQLLYESVRRGQETIVALNLELKKQHFGEETYEFEARWVPGMKPYHDFFGAVMEMDDLGEGRDLFAADVLPEELGPVRDELIRLLLSPDAEAARKKLDELSDYRNYKRYEIWKRVDGREPVALSTYGTASGGQFETPAYVIRLAAVSSAFRLREKAKGHLMMLVTDEAFGKMDEARARSVLSYLTRTLGFQVIFIVPNTRSGAFLDLVTHQVLFAKVASDTGHGELKHQILMQWQELNQETLPDLWRVHRDRVINQAVLELGEAP